MAKLKDTEIDGNLYVSGDIQIGDTDVMTAIDELNTNLSELNANVGVIATVPTSKIVALNASVISITSALVHQVGKILNVNVIMDISSSRSGGVFDIQGYEPIANQMLLAVKSDSLTTYALYVQDSTKYILPYTALPAGTYRVTGTLILE